VNFNNGNVNNNTKSTNYYYVRPVRSGQWSTFANIYRQYLNCRKNKRNTINALKFEIRAEENLLKLQEELQKKTYYPSRSVCFVVNRPKPREIFAADFKDRVVHHILVDYLEKIWEKIFICDSYACRKDKGTHKGVKRLQSFMRRITKNGSRRAYYMQLDIRSFFVNIDKGILFNLITKRVKNEDILWLARTVIFHDCTKDYIFKGDRSVLKKIPSHKSLFEQENKRGLPIGNLTSQFFANVYLNELDQFVKHNLKVKYYIRYADDFILLSDKKEELAGWTEKIETFLKNRLNLTLHPKRRKLQPISNGIDFLGYIVRRNYILVRRRVINNMKTKLRYFQKSSRVAMLKDLQSSIQSYLGHLKWANSYNLIKKLATKMIVATHFKIDDYRLVSRYRRGAEKTGSFSVYGQAVESTFVVNQTGNVGIGRQPTCFFVASRACDEGRQESATGHSYRQGAGLAG